MRDLRAISVLAAAVLAFALLGGGTAGAGEDAITIPTVYTTHDAFRSSGSHEPGDLLAVWQQNGGVDLCASPPPGTGWVPPEPRLSYGSLETGGRSMLVALGQRDGNQGVLGVDLDGDGSLRGPGEVVQKEGRLGRHRGRVVLRWKFPRIEKGALRIDLTFLQLARSWDAVLVTQAGPAPLPLTDAPPAGTQKATTGQHVQYAQLATAAGTMSAAFLRDEGDRLTVLVDRNRNGVLGDGGESLVGVIDARDASQRIWKVEGVPHEGGTSTLAYREADPQAQVTFKASALGARRGTVRRGNHEYALHILDGDFDGTYGTAGDWWWFGPAKALTKFNRLSLDSMLEADEPFYVDAAWRLITVGADGSAVLARDASAPSPHEYFHTRTEKVNNTRYFPLFARDTAFVQKHGIDTRRPKAAPPAWYHDVGVREALRRAKAENKPLLVDFEADWCNICKRWDYFVYCDQEVATLLQGFVRLKVNVDFNFGDDMKRFGGENPPYLVFLDSDGNPLLSFPEVDAKGQETGRTLNGLCSFQRPLDFAATLRAARDAWAARSGG